MRTEDPELLVGGARYVSDLPLEHPLYLVFVLFLGGLGVLGGLSGVN